MQMVNLMRDGQPVRMSKRTGNAITLTDLLEEVPIDSARFLFNMHDAGSGIDFDLDQAVKTDNDNPVYYVQYAHARICSILKKMESEGVQFAGAEQVDATLLTEPSEMDLIRMLAAFPQEIVMAAEKYDPSRINRFVIDLASAFHRFYGSCRIQGADPAVQQARLALCIGVKNVIFNVLTMFKINCAGEDVKANGLALSVCFADSSPKGRASARNQKLSMDCQSLPLWGRWHCVSNDGEGRKPLPKITNKIALRLPDAQRRQFKIVFNLVIQNN